MKKAHIAAMNTSVVNYAGILLDSTDNFYTYQQSIPVYRLGDGLNAIGQAIPKKSKRQLLCDLVLSRVVDNKKLYPHIVFDCTGKLYAVMLLVSPTPDNAVRPLDEYTATSP